MPNFARHLFLKQAASITEALAPAAQAGMTDRPAPMGYTPAHTQGASNVTTTGQLGIGAIGSLFGEGPAGLIASFMPMLGPMLAQYGIDVSKPFAVGTGPSQQNYAERQKVMADVTQRQMRNSADQFKKVAQGLAGFVGNIAGQMAHTPEDKAKVESMVQGVGNFIAKAPPQMVGIFVNQMAQQSPEFRDIISATVPGFIFDYSPLIDATYQQNGGRWSTEAFNENVENMESSYERDFKPAGFSSAQDILYSSQVANELTGAKGFNPLATRNVMQSAQAFRDAGMAHSFGDALTLTRSIAPQAASNPGAAVRQARWIDAQAKQHGLRPDEYAKAAEFARQRGIAVPAAMAALNYGRRLESQVTQGGLTPGLGGAAADTLNSMGTSRSMKILQAAVNSGKITADGAQGMMGHAGNPKAFAARVEGLLRDPTVAQTWQKADPSALLGQMDPASVNRVNAAEAVTRWGSQRGNSRLQKLLADPSRSAMLAKGVYKGLSPSEINAVQSRAGQRSLAAALAGKMSDAAPRPYDATPVASLDVTSPPKPTKVPAPVPVPASTPVVPG